MSKTGTAKLFPDGRSQAVRLPQSFASKEIESAFGESIIASYSVEDIADGVCTNLTRLDVDEPRGRAGNTREDTWSQIRPRRSYGRTPLPKASQT